jgi:hypothetical protein
MEHKGQWLRAQLYSTREPENTEEQRCFCKRVPSVKGKKNRRNRPKVPKTYRKDGKSEHSTVAGVMTGVEKEGRSKQLPNLTAYS